MGWIDAEGYLFLTGRATHMIISGGVNIYPREAEAVLMLHPAVRDVAMIGVPDADFGEAVKAVIELVDGMKLRQAWRPNLSHFVDQNWPIFSSVRGPSIPSTSFLAWPPASCSSVSFASAIAVISGIKRIRSQVAPCRLRCRLACPWGMPRMQRFCAYWRRGPARERRRSITYRCDRASLSSRAPVMLRLGLAERDGIARACQPGGRIVIRRHPMPLLRNDLVAAISRLE